MLVMHAPPLWIKTLVLYGILSSLSPRIVSHRLTPAIELLNPHYRRNSCRTTAMAAPIVDSSGESFPEHATGKWYSVPDLRLRDHRFTVPLDYRDPVSSLKISIFAREVVAERTSSLTRTWVPSSPARLGSRNPGAGSSNPGVLGSIEPRRWCWVPSNPRWGSFEPDAGFKGAQRLGSKEPRPGFYEPGAGFLGTQNCFAVGKECWSCGVKAAQEAANERKAAQEAANETKLHKWQQMKTELHKGQQMKKAAPKHGSSKVQQPMLQNIDEMMRGTGLSTLLTTSSMLQFKSARDLADFLKHFRADSIVNDAEFIRVRLVPCSGHWTVLGQLWRFLCHHHLSFAPQGLKQVLLTGGIPPIGDGCTADTVYGACFEQVARQNEKYYKRNPQDIEVVCEVVNYLAESEGGGSSAGFERLHYLFERVWDPVIVPGAPKKISFYFLNAVSLTIDWVLIETHSMLLSTSQFTGASSRWSAQRLRAKHENKFDAIKAAGEGRPVLFTGEVRPWCFVDCKFATATFTCKHQSLFDIDLRKPTSLLNKPSAVAPRQVPECHELVMAANAIPLSDMAQSNRRVVSAQSKMRKKKLETGTL
ncbi:hypothetical protein SLEP1_g10012 [Rubroshorea leprosula]|uniref:Uncharacterized protein n=1 Tax=Rubroshorea leprosula TaxID=152421 RepID=A0AAV5IHP8_9ROSI|nr:hypothetical protein SLEP1_g10012 [Rubroshorea leprosula]